MKHGDHSRKKALVEYGFRLPSAYDNRPLAFEEFQGYMKQVVYVSATPSAFEKNEAFGEVVEQVVRPTGLLDPLIEIRKSAIQVEDCLEEIRREKEKGGRILVTTLTKHLAEELTTYLKELGVKANYLHSDVDVIERLKIIHDLRLGVFDVLVGINLLREGLDLPEVTLVVILDADREGFLRSETALIQTCGRAARNEQGRVIMYADRITQSIQKTIDITTKRREKQEAYNKKHSIVPKTVIRKLELLDLALEGVAEPLPGKKEEQIPKDHKAILRGIKEWEEVMKKAAKELRFEDAAHARDIMRRLQNLELL
jgi:excinuclease ABC subunit B